MTDMNLETEKAPEQGRETAKAGATFFTLTWWLIIGLVVGTFAMAFFTDQSLSSDKPAIGFALLVPLAIAVIQRTTSDKGVTWYKKEARIAGIIIGAIAAILVY